MTDDDEEAERFFMRRRKERRAAGVRNKDFSITKESVRSLVRMAGIFGILEKRDLPTSPLHRTLRYRTVRHQTSTDD